MLKNEIAVINKGLKSLLVIVIILSLSGCADYRVTIQGVNLDHFIASRPVDSDSLAVKRQAAAHNDLGVLREREGDLTGALEQYRIARKQDPELVLAYINAGNVKVKLNKLTAAADLYRQALQREPDQPEALNNLAWVYLLRRKNLPEAINLLNQAIRADPENRYRYLDSLGWAMWIGGRREAALSTLTDALTETPPEEKYLRGETHYHLGLIYHEQGDKQLAEAHFRQSLEEYPAPEREEAIRRMEGMK